MDMNQKIESLKEAMESMDTLLLAFMGISNGLLQTLKANDDSTVDSLADSTGTQPDYIDRWADAAYANELIDIDGDTLSLTSLGEAFLPDSDDSLTPMAIQSLLSPLMANEVDAFLTSGDQPGEELLERFDRVTPWFGTMLEQKFAPLFRNEVLPRLDCFAADGSKPRRVLDLGAGNGWYLRELVGRFEHIQAVGVDSMAPAIETARQKTREAGLQQRLEFQVADIIDFEADTTFDVVVMNRTLHHVWSQRADLASTLDRTMGPDGQLVIWEPAWPQQREALRTPRRRGLGMRNLMEHAMGNSLLSPARVANWMEESGLTVEVRHIDPVETIFVGRRF